MVDDVLVTSERSFDCRIETADMKQPTINPNVSLPPLPAKPDAYEIVEMMTLIALVLSIRYSAEICPLIVKPVAVYVIDHFWNRKPLELENILMQLNGGVLAVSLHGAMGVPLVSILGSAPLEAICQLEHIVIYSRKTALCKFDFLHIDSTMASRF